MRRISLPIFAVLFLAASGIAQTRGIGAGGYVQAGNAGETGGLNAKLFLTPATAVDFSMSVETDPFGQSMGFYASYLMHYWDLIPVHEGKLPLYVGPNLGVGVWSNSGGGTALRAGAIGGMAYCLPQGTAPIDIYVQLNPTFEYNTADNALRMDMYLQLGVRFFFDN
ncbi:MAG TPA: hypothetical protein VLM37_06825 [Fibrobacteraceae bacterium]|nr:hypothetical protein [Fibrobacteraceae bacterium]